MRARGKNDDYNSNSLDLTSRSKTILRAFDRLQNEPILSAKFVKIGNAFKGEKTINVLLLGCDRREGKNDRVTERIFKDLGREQCVNLSLFGPNLVFDVDDDLTSRGRSNESGEDDDENDDDEEEKRKKKTKGKAARINVVERERCLFHERNREKDEIEYDVAFAFNAGVWGYDSWLESFKRVLKRYPNAPIIVSAYSMKECELDEDCVREGFGEDEIKFVWEAEENEECAGERTGGEESGSENSAWMCFVSSRSYGE